MSIPPIDNTQKFLGELASSLPGKVTTFPDSTATSGSEILRQVGQELAR